MPYKDPLVRNRRQRERRAERSAIARQALYGLDRVLDGHEPKSDAERTGAGLLRVILEERGITLAAFAEKLKELLEAEQVKTVAGEREVVPDNDVRARGLELLERLYERWNVIPLSPDRQPGRIILNVISYHKPEVMTIEMGKQ